MTDEKRDQAQEEPREIVVLDAGIENSDGPDWACCFVNYIPLRW